MIFFFFFQKGAQHHNCRQQLKTLVNWFFSSLGWHCSFSFSTQHEMQWNKNILAANWPHHGNSIDQPSQVLRKIHPSCQFPCINSSATTRGLNRQTWYLASGNKIYNHYFVSLMIHLSQRWDTKWTDDIGSEQGRKQARRTDRAEFTGWRL